MQVDGADDDANNRCGCVEVKWPGDSGWERERVRRERKTGGRWGSRIPTLRTTYVVTPTYLGRKWTPLLFVARILYFRIRKPYEFSQVTKFFVWGTSVVADARPLPIGHDG